MHREVVITKAHLLELIQEEALGAGLLISGLKLCGGNSHRHPIDATVWLADGTRVVYDRDDLGRIASRGAIAMGHRIDAERRALIVHNLSGKDTEDYWAVVPIRMADRLEVERPQANRRGLLALMGLAQAWPHDSRRNS